MLGNLIRETATCSGSGGTYTLGGAAVGYRGFVAAIGDGNSVLYLVRYADPANNSSAAEWGIATVTDGSPDTLVRSTLLGSTTGSAISWTGGRTLDIYCSVPMERAVWLAAAAAAYSLPYLAGTTGSATQLGPNTTTTKKFLRMTGTGSAGAAPAWDTLVDGDIPAALTGKTINGLTVSTSTGTLTIPNGATFATSGAYSVTLTATGATNVTLPTTGTLATLAGLETLSNKNINGSLGAVTPSTAVVTTLTATGNVVTGGGSSSLSFAGGVVPVVQTVGATNSTSSLGILKNNNNTSIPAIYLAAARGGSFTVVQSGDILGRIGFHGGSGSALIEGARITATVTNTAGSSDMPTKLEFATSPDGSASPVVAVTISDAQAVTIANSLVAGTAGVTVVDATGHICLKSYTVATVPSAAGDVKQIFVSNEAGGAVPAFSDGTNWRRYTDRAIIS